MTTSKGNSTRYDNDLSGNHIQRERDKSRGIGVFLNFNKRFCEKCRMYKPKTNTVARKGWICASCKNKAAGEKEP